MQNPWTDLPTELPYVLRDDAEQVREFNTTHDSDDDHYLHVELLPEPYLGDPTNAPVVLLYRNPSFRDGVLSLHQEPAYQDSVRECLLHEVQEYPFFVLNPRNEFPGKDYWTSKLGELIDIHGVERVTRFVCTIEFSPYRSRKFMNLELPSQEYNLKLVRNAIERKATIVMMCGDSYWKEAVPELETVAYRRNSPQCQHVTSGNCPKAFKVIDRILRET